MTPGRVKLTVLLAGLAASALVLIAWTQPWFELALSSGQLLSVSGDVVAGGLAALGLAGLALGAALAIAGPVFRVILGALEVAIGALVVVSGFLATLDPVGSSAPAVTEATGVSGDSSILALVSAITSTAWPAVAIALGVVIVLVGVAVIATSRRWPASSRKYQSARFEEASGERSSVGDWDSLSEGRDPT